MMLTSTIRKFVLTSHITSSVGWVGAVVVFLVLAIKGIASPNIDLARSMYIAMELSAWYVIVPFCIASLVTGIVQAVGTPWGLLKHYWIVVKLFLTIAATIFLLLHMKPISYLSGLATKPSFSIGQEYGLRVQVLSDAGAAIILLLIITTISVYKPWGKIQSNKRGNDLNSKDEKVNKSWKTYVIVGVIVLILFIIFKHLLGGGMHGH